MSAAAVADDVKAGGKAGSASGDAKSPDDDDWGDFASPANDNRGHVAPAANDEDDWGDFNDAAAVPAADGDDDHDDWGAFEQPSAAPAEPAPDPLVGLESPEFEQLVEKVHGVDVAGTATTLMSPDDRDYANSCPVTALAS